MSREGYLELLRSAPSYVRSVMHTQVSCKPLSDVSDYTAFYAEHGNLLGDWDGRGYSEALSLKEPAPDTRIETIDRAICRLFGSLIGYD